MAVSDLIPLLLIIIALIGAAFQISREGNRISHAERAGILLSWAFLIIIGFGGIWGFIGHTLFADRVALSIGWPPGNPFQQEVALTNLALGVLGLLSFRIAGSFRVATIIAYTIFMIGAGIGHIWQIFSAGNMAVNNAGLLLWIDLLVPPAIIILYLVQHTMHLQETRPSLAR